MPKGRGQGGSGWGGARGGEGAMVAGLGAWPSARRSCEVMIDWIRVRERRGIWVLMKWSRRRPASSGGTRRWRSMMRGEPSGWRCARWPQAMSGSAPGGRAKTPGTESAGSAPGVSAKAPRALLAEAARAASAGSPAPAASRSASAASSPAASSSSGSPGAAGSVVIGVVRAGGLDVVLLHQLAEVLAVDVGGAGGVGDVAAVAPEELEDVVALERGDPALLGVLEGDAFGEELGEGGTFKGRWEAQT